MAICDRFHCLPSQAEAEDASVIRRLQLEGMYRELAGPEPAEELI